MYHKSTVHNLKKNPPVFVCIFIPRNSKISDFSDTEIVPSIQEVCFAPMFRGIQQIVAVHQISPEE